MERLADFLNEQLHRIVLSNPRRKEEVLKVKVRPLLLRGKLVFQAEELKGNQAFHRNMDLSEAKDYLKNAIDQDFRQMEVWSDLGTMQVLVSKSGNKTVKVKKASQNSNTPKIVKASLLAHNQKKRYILEEGSPIPFLCDLGVMTAEGKIVRSRYDKFRQINRFLEFIEDVRPQLDEGRELTILDFGCGKSYLTFAMYYYLKELQGLDIRVIGLDLKTEVIERCRQLAKKYGYEKLTFLAGDIASYESGGTVDMVVTLHACDTASDYALDKAVKWGAKVILSVPCCQHELNAQIHSSVLEPVLKYGLIKERVAALVTDALRAGYLEEQGYQVQILEFIDMEHTPKNILIRAVKTGGRKKNEKLDACAELLGVEPLLGRLLKP